MQGQGASWEMQILHKTASQEGCRVEGGKGRGYGSRGYSYKEDIVCSQELDIIESKNDWCCMYHILSLQEDFANEKSMLQHYIEGR